MKNSIKKLLALGLVLVVCLLTPSLAASEQLPRSGAGGADSDSEDEAKQPAQLKKARTVPAAAAAASSSVLTMTGPVVVASVEPAAAADVATECIICFEKQTEPLSFTSCCKRVLCPPCFEDNAIRSHTVACLNCRRYELGLDDSAGRRMRAPLVLSPAKLASANDALIAAANTNNFPAVQAAIDAGAYINHQSNDLKETALMIAARNQNIPMTKYLISKGCCVNFENIEKNTAVMIAALKGYLLIVQHLSQVPGVNLNAKEARGFTALMIAAVKGYLPIIQHLTQVPGVDINAQDARGSTTLMIAAVKGYLPIVQHLTQVPGIDINAQTQLGNTALMLAAANGKLAITQHLLSKAAIITLTNNEGRTAIAIAQNKRATNPPVYDPIIAALEAAAVELAAVAAPAATPE